MHYRRGSFLLPLESPLPRAPWVAPSTPASAPLPLAPLRAAAKGAGREPTQAPRTVAAGPLYRWSRLSGAAERRDGTLSGSAAMSAARREIRGARSRIRQPSGRICVVRPRGPSGGGGGKCAVAPTAGRRSYVPRPRRGSPMAGSAACDGGALFRGGGDSWWWLGGTTGTARRDARQ
jgi:hypothetical protein